MLGCVKACSHKNFSTIVPVACRCTDIRSNKHDTSSSSDRRTLVISSVHALAAAATSLTASEVISASSNICTLAIALPTVPPAFSAGEALSMAGVLGSALATTGHACMGDLLAAVLDRSPPVDAAAVVSVPQCPLLPASACLEELTLAAEVRDAHFHPSASDTGCSTCGALSSSKLVCSWF
jgi:hypothetical protein